MSGQLEPCEDPRPPFISAGWDLSWLGGHVLHTSPPPLRSSSQPLLFLHHPKDKRK